MQLLPLLYDIDVRAAVADDAPAICRTINLAQMQKQLHQNNQVEPANIEPDEDAIAAMRQYLANDRATHYLVTTNVFPTDFPLHDLAGRQICGFGSVQHVEKKKSLKLERLYTVSSPIKTGSLLLEKFLQQAAELDVEELRLWPETDRAQNWYLKKGAFIESPVNPYGRSDLMLARDNFDNALAGLRIDNAHTRALSLN